MRVALNGEADRRSGFVKTLLTQAELTLSGDRVPKGTLLQRFANR